MVKIRQCSVLLIFVLITSCLPLKDVPENSPVSQPTGSFSKDLTTPVSTELLETSATVPTIRTVQPTEIITAKNSIEQNCIQVDAKISSNEPLTGTLVLSALTGNRQYLLNFAHNNEQDIENSIINVGTSPDGKWWVYIENNKWLVFRNPQQNILRKIQKGEKWFQTYWIDNDHIAINDISDPYKAPATIVIDSATSEQQVFFSDYPDLILYDRGPSNPFHFIYSSVAYDPDMNYVVYPKTIDGVNYIVLWDRQGQAEISELKDDGYFYHNPVWSMDGKQFYIAVEKDGIDDLFRVTINGKIEQITNFQEIGLDKKIGMISLSPDGKFLAFWTSSSNKDVNEELMVIDLEKQKNTNYCIPSTLNPGMQPIWSPDSRFLATEDRTGENQYRTILFDIQDLWAAEIDNVFPDGWLK